MKSFSVISCMLFVLLAGARAVLAQAPTYPSTPVRIIVPLTAGGGVDILARLVGQHFNVVWGQPFIVDNRPGAGGNIGMQTVAKAQPDGYTLLVTSSGLVTNAAVRDSGYDPVRDFSPISRLSGNPYILLVTPGLQVASVKDLIALARAKPGQLTFGSSGAGGILHLTAELFCTMAGIQATHVPYKGVAEVYPNVASGQVSFVFGSPISALPFVKGGRLKGIAISGAERNKALPELPTVAEAGLPGYDVTVWFGLLAPARMPPALVNRLSAEARTAMSNPDVVRRLEAEGTEAVGNSPEAFAKEITREYDKWRGLVKKAGLKL
jgi:tripartite-type tricarboxylate transporter receptor subunit TctC